MTMIADAATDDYRPLDLFAEPRLLGALIVYPDHIPEAQAEGLRPEHFAKGRHYTIASALWGMVAEGEAVTELGLAIHLQHRSQLADLGGEAAIADLVVQGTLDRANIPEFARYVRDRALRRQAATKLRTAADAVEDAEGDPAEIVERTVAELTDLSAGRRNDSTVTIREALDSLFSARPDDHCVRFPIAPVDEMLGGLQAGGQYVIAGVTGAGKSIMAAQIILEAIRDGHSVLLYSLEMPPEEVGARLLSQVAGFPIERRKNSPAWPKDRRDEVDRARTELESLPLVIGQNTGMTVQQIAAEAMAFHRRGQADLIVIDYLHLVNTNTPKSDSYTRSLEIGSQSLKRLALRLNVPLVLLAQLNAEAMKNGKPRLADLKWASGIGQDADAVLMVHRPDMKSRDGAKRNDAWLMVEKNRNGFLGEKRMRFDEAALCFRDNE